MDVSHTQCIFQRVGLEVTVSSTAYALTLNLTELKDSVDCALHTNKRKQNRMRKPTKTAYKKKKNHIPNTQKTTALNLGLMHVTA